MTNIKTNKQIIDEEAGLMIRADKTLKELMEEKPESRWDVNYWHIKYEEIIKELSQKNEVNKLSDFIKENNIVQGDIARKKRQEKYLSNSKFKLIEGNDFLFTGLDLNHCKFISEKQFNRLKRTTPKAGDILFVRSGSIGNLVGIVKNLNDYVISSHVNRVYNLERINSFYVLVFLLSKYGQLQLERQQRGVAVVEINFNEFGRIHIPILSLKTQSNIEIKYKEASAFHDKAMEAKKKRDERKYKENIEKAEKMLWDLIHKTEQVVRGERDDVI